MGRAVESSFRVRISKLVLKDNVPAGMDPCVVMGLVPKLRKTSEDHEPITVKRLCCGNWRIEDGRHRYFASVIAGRPDILAIEEVENAS